MGHVFPTGSEEDVFFDAPSSPIEDLPFFDVSSDSLPRSLSEKRKSLVLKDPKKNMTDLLMTFEISVVGLFLEYIFFGYTVFTLNLNI